MAKQKQNEKPAVRASDALRIAVAAHEKNMMLILSVGHFLDLAIDNPDTTADQIRDVAKTVRENYHAARLAMGMDNDD